MFLGIEKEHHRLRVDLLNNFLIYAYLKTNRWQCLGGQKREGNDRVAASWVGRNHLA